MPLPRFKTRDEVPEAFRDSYVQRGDEWVPDDSGYQSKNSQLLDEKKRIQQQFDELKSQLGDMTPEQIKKLREDQQRAEDEAARKAGDFDKLLDKRINETKAEYEKRIEALSPYKTKFEDLHVEVAIRDAAAKAGVTAADLPLIVEIHKGRRIKYDEKTGKTVVVDKDGDVTGLTVEKFYAETFKGEAPKFYSPEGGSGGGASSSGARTTTNGAPTVTDPASFIANLDKIAKGEVKVAA